jgi:alkylhydroperoxidase family enzyme
MAWEALLRKQGIHMPNPMLGRVPRAAMNSAHQQVWDLGMERTGEATIVEVMANHPELLSWYFDGFYAKLFYNADPAMSVDVRTKELLRYKLSKQHGCLFCNRFNAVDAVQAGITQQQLDAILTPTPALFDEKDLVVIELADQMKLQNMDGQLGPELYAKLRKFYNDRQIMEMGMICAVLTGMAKLIFTFDMVTREEQCPITPRTGTTTAYAARA